ncbi:MAG: N-6 DNA methylase, partial [Aeriscardovia sp.]|nr:N-6 DNA methylase [Aeriscardovia sp.]
KNPAFTERDRLKTFDLVLANPPYSIKQWDRDAFSHDKYGRNFLGTPPQSRADFAFFQHIIKSLDPKTGRAAILFPHGILFRAEEQDMRKELVKRDVVECVIGIGKNLFFNSPMEACIVICRMNKPFSHRGRVLFINARDEVVRLNAQSYLEEKNIRRISDTYKEFREEAGFSAIATVEEIQRNDSKLSIALYVTDMADSNAYLAGISLDDTVSEWQDARIAYRDSYDDLLNELQELRAME